MFSIRGARSHCYLHVSAGSSSAVWRDGCSELWVAAASHLVSTEHIHQSAVLAYLYLHHTSSCASRLIICNLLTQRAQYFFQYAGRCHRVRNDSRAACLVGGPSVVTVMQCRAWWRTLCACKRGQEGGQHGGLNTALSLHDVTCCGASRGYSQLTTDSDEARNCRLGLLHTLPSFVIGMWSDNANANTHSFATAALNEIAAKSDPFCCTTHHCTH